MGNFALQLDGSQNYVSLGTLGTLGTDMANGFYARMILKTTSTALGEFGMEHTAQCSGAIIGFNEGPQGTNASGKIWVDIIDNTATINHIRGHTTNSTGFNDGKKHTIEVIVNVSAKTIVIKVDGVSQAITYEAQTTLVTFSNFNAGWIVGASYFNGSISPTMPCTVDEFLIGYDATHIYGHYKFDEGTGTTTADATGNGNTATLTGSPPPAWVTGLYKVQLDGLIQSAHNTGGNITLTAFPVSSQNSDRYLLVSVASHQGGGSTGATGVTYGGVAMTLLASEIGSFGEFVQWWGLQNPASGTGNIVTAGLSGGDMTAIAAYSLYNAKQTYSVASAVANGSAASSSVSLTPNSADNWIFDIVESEATPSVSGSNVQDWAQDGAPNSFDNANGSSIQQVGSPASATLSWSYGSSQRYNQAAVAIEPSIPAPAPLYINRGRPSPFKPGLPR